MYAQVPPPTSEFDAEPPDITHTAVSPSSFSCECTSGLAVQTESDIVIVNRYYNYVTSKSMKLPVLDIQHVGDGKRCV